MNYKIANALNNDILTLVIFPTEQCNFRCFYCYESFELGKMSEETVQSILKFVRKRASSLKQLNISWFGGEPLMAKDIVIYLSQEFQKISQEFNITYHANMTTNGYYLTNKLLDDLVNLGITLYQITLDGSKETHDKIRVLSNKEGSFDQIWNNLLDFKNLKSDFNIMIRVHYSPINIDDIKTFSKKIVNQFSNDNRYSIYFKDISKLGSSNDDNLLTCNTNEIQKYKMELSLIAKDFNLTSIESDYICYASKTNTYLIRSDASLGKCTVALDEEVNNIGKLKENGELELDQEKCRLWSIGLQTENPDHLACPYYSLIKPNIIDIVK